MKQSLKNALKVSFEPPKPMKKEQFLQHMEILSIGMPEFIRLQAAYIRKRIWIISTLIFTAAFLGAQWVEQDVLWCISGSMPLLAWLILAESRRSECYAMAEFELSTRFSLKSVMLARLGIIGISNFLLICLVIPFAASNSKVSLFQTGICIFCPYLLTTFLGLWVSRNLRGKEEGVLCGGIAILVSLSNSIFYQTIPDFYTQKTLLWWIIAFLAFGIGTAKQCYLITKQTEELAWNLS